MVLLSKSSLHIQGKLTKANGSPVTNTFFGSNGICLSFEESEYKTNFVEIDNNKNVYLTTLMPNSVSADPSGR